MSKKSVLILLLSIALAVIFQPFEARAAWGDFDASFGVQGFTIDEVTGHRPRQVFVQPDGKILVTGYVVSISGGKAFFLRRYSPTGQLDSTFGRNGAAISPEINSLGSEYQGERIAILPNGKIAVAGIANGYAAVWQFTENGRNDSAFGQDGLRILTAFPNPYQIEINVQNRKLLISESNYSYENSVRLLRLNSNGANDNTFGNFGETATNIKSLSYGIVVDNSNGKITIGGSRLNPAGQGVDRKLSNGQTDSTFFPTSSTVSGIVKRGLLQTAEGKLLIHSDNIAGYWAVDMSRFGENGRYESNLRISNDPVGELQGHCYSGVFALQSDGKLVVSQADRLIRLNAESSFLSKEFCECANLGWMENQALPAIQTDDKMVFAGVYNDYLTIVRLLPN